MLYSHPAQSWVFCFGEADRAHIGAFQVMRYRACMTNNTNGQNFINNVPKILQVALEQPVTVVQGTTQIACIISIPLFTQLAGNEYLSEIECWDETLRDFHDLGQGTPDDRSQRFCALIVHAADEKAVVPLLMNRQPVAVAVPPPRNRDASAPPKGAWVRIEVV